MTEEQLLALEVWVVSIVRDEDRASDLHETRTRNMSYQDVREKFGLERNDGGLWR